MNDAARKVIQLKDTIANIEADIKRRQRHLRREQLALLQTYSVHDDIGNGKKLLLTEATIIHINGGSQFGVKGFDRAGAVVSIYDWDVDTVTCNIRTAGRWETDTRTAINIPLTLIDEMRTAYLEGATK